jgi:hypothetical protein
MSAGRTQHGFNGCSRLRRAAVVALAAGHAASRYREAVSFSLPGDPGYLRAKRARRGTTHLDPVFNGFLDHFRKRYAVAPLWLEPDCFKAHGRLLPGPRLNIVMERTSEYRKFFTSPRPRQIADMLVTELSGADLQAVFGMPRETPGTYPYRDDMHVCYSDFEAVAKDEAHGLLTREELTTFTSSLGIGEQFWCSQRLSGPPIIFVYTDAQAAALAMSPVRQRWADGYFAIVKTHDEFNYLVARVVSV